MSEPAYEIIGRTSDAGPFVFTCEHATRLLPEWELDPRDRHLVEDHWGWDIGAADLTRELVARTGSCGVLSRFSRLVCDPNRHPSETSFVVEAIDGEPLHLNLGIDDAERRRRRERYFDPFHDAVDRVIRQRLHRAAPVQLCAVHSFTPQFLGMPRPMEVGVLFDVHDEPAWLLESALAKEGFVSVLNAPYSGQDGLIYAAQRHGAAHGIVYLELEVRQDLIDTPDKAACVGERIARAFERYLRELAA